MSSSSTSDSSDSSSCSSSSSSSDSESSIDEKKGVCLFSKSAGKGNALKPKAAPAPNKKRARDAETPSGVQPVKTAVPVASKSAAAAAPATETAEKSGKKNKGKSMGPRFSLFVGQLPFDATASSIEEFFTSKVKERVEVRPLTDKKTGAFRGIAFVDVFTPEGLAAGLALNKELFNGRRLSVEQSLPGSGASEKRREKLSTLKSVQSSGAKESLEARIKQVVATSSGGLTEADFDERAKQFLLMFPQELSCTALLELGRKFMGPVRNRPAYVMGVLKRIRQEQCTH